MLLRGLAARLNVRQKYMDIMAPYAKQVCYVIYNFFGFVLFVRFFFLISCFYFCFLFLFFLGVVLHFFYIDEVRSAGCLQTN